MLAASSVPVITYILLAAVVSILVFLFARENFSKVGLFAHILLVAGFFVRVISIQFLGQGTVWRILAIISVLSFIAGWLIGSFNISKSFRVK